MSSGSSTFTKAPSIPSSFTAKKSQVLTALHRPADAYTDNSPKGSVDVQIQELIDEINAYEGLVTTSSCAGRVAVFVEGGGSKEGRDEGKQRKDAEEDEDEEREGADGESDDGKGTDQALSSARTTTTSPGGKGGGRWLYVSHDPVPVHSTRSSKEHTDDPTIDKQDYYYSSLFHLPSTISSTFSSPPSPTSLPPRLIHLSFSPLILHIHCATLHHARPLLSAAINAGFRESGVQSLRILDPAEAERGVMVAIRTAGLSFDTVVGIVDVTENGEEVRRVVSEDYLAMCASVINQRFMWNEERRERFRKELRGAMERAGLATNAEGGESAREDKMERRRRKREEGLARQKMKQETSSEKGEESLDEGLTFRELG
ncbi:hypothetical protein H2200_003648 [Cladophialophora chaetospira]|uniref:tRNA(Phe) 7-[(3-amino-3-carboxypropyl)-4-demethylwyosine(37)-N(4)]-methyltransferase n=1 Tax=Cladophialophora chaetospira TaxID=386627 RepID=A0AA38XEL1_9EURO|nr:hypothetical protein H2200_003648 [Cladophialophora chaetospira]